ncbi:Phosphate-selective porin O and P [Posidoniimonas corsicana]|uniref:Phosphate-selective porin O and P n=1 Tax=Posidoniimonas corsicana TaxID=1938618 RepID=A0A5C5VCI7_9BACT|nr:porin [Posidoniimonas corsicana]TWT35730.1 Phosphate-selective porin O and P [Posidoniimonas corsicana]
MSKYSYSRRFGWRAGAATLLSAVMGLQTTANAEDTFRPLPTVEPAAAVAPVAYNSWLQEESDEPAPADGEKTIEERMAELEKNYSSLQEDYDSLSKSLSGYAKSGHGQATMKVNGRIHADMWSFPGSTPGINVIETEDPNTSPVDRVGFRRMRFGVKGDLPYNMLYKIEMEFAGGNDSEFRDAYLGWNELPIFRTLLIGNQKRPYGLDHLNSSRYNVFLERPFVIESFNQDARRFGVCSYGYSEDLAWNWRYGIYNQRLIQDEGNYSSDSFQAQVAGRLANTIWWDQCSDGRGYAHWAVSGTWADTDPLATTNNYAGSGLNEARFRHRPEARSINRWVDTGVIPDGDDYALLGLEGVINVGATQIVSEYQHVWQNRTVLPDVNLHGAYVYWSYFLTGEHMPWDRESGTLDRIYPFENFFLVDRCRGGTGYGLGAWQVALRYSYADFNDQDVFGGIGQSVTAGLNWYWSPYARMQFNYIYGEITDRDADNDESTPQPVNLQSGDYHILGTRLMVDF